MKPGAPTGDQARKRPGRRFQCRGEHARGRQYCLKRIAARVPAAYNRALQEIPPRFVPFPVALPEDPDLLWLLARREDFPPDEAARALEKIEAEFWETKAGLKLQRDRVEKTFAEFIARVPAAALADSGMKRHYKEPEPRKTLHRMGPAPQADRGATSSAEVTAPAEAKPADRAPKKKSPDKSATMATAAT